VTSSPLDIFTVLAVKLHCGLSAHPHHDQGVGHFFPDPPIGMGHASTQQVHQLPRVAGHYKVAQHLYLRMCICECVFV
jgi:hypothetical protein